MDKLNNYPTLIQIPAYVEIQCRIRMTLHISWEYRDNIANGAGAVADRKHLHGALSSSYNSKLASC